jgi:hypothetical protein
MGADTQAWLGSCLLDNMLATTGEHPDAKKRQDYLLDIQMMIIFGKEASAEIKKPTASAEANLAKLGPRLSADSQAVTAYIVKKCTS